MAIKLLTSFIQQVRQDIRRRGISADEGNSLIDMASRLIAEL